MVCRGQKLRIGPQPGLTDEARQISHHLCRKHVNLRVMSEKMLFKLPSVRAVGFTRGWWEIVNSLVYHHWGRYYPGHFSFLFFSQALPFVCQQIWPSLAKKMAFPALNYSCRQSIFRSVHALPMLTILCLASDQLPAYANDPLPAVSCGPTSSWPWFPDKILEILHGSSASCVHHPLEALSVPFCNPEPRTIMVSCSWGWCHWRGIH